VGIMDDGSVRSGSALDFVKNKVKLVADKMTEWQQNGTIDRISEKFSKGFSKAVETGGKALDYLKEKAADAKEQLAKWKEDGTLDAIAEGLKTGVATAVNVAGAAFNFAGNAIKWVKDNSSWLLPVLGGVVAGFTAFNVISPIVTTLVGAWKAYKTVATGVTAAQGILNFVMTANPIGLVAVAIGGLVAAGIVLWRNWDKISAAADKLWQKVTGAFNKIKTKVSPVFEWFGDKLGAAKDALSSIPGIGKIFDSMYLTPAAALADGVRGHATGSAYFKGGLTRINEGGRGELVQLPNGSRIYPHDRSVKELSKTNNVYNINVTVQGGSNPHETGRIIAEEIKKALEVA